MVEQLGLKAHWGENELKLLAVYEKLPSNFVRTQPTVM